MLVPSQSLFAAILDDDRATVKVLLEKDPRLPVQATQTLARYESGIAHWVYAGNTALHVAAAGHRVEIAKMLLAAGADPNSEKNHRRSQPLHYASDGYLENPFWDAKRQVAMIRILRRAGADIHARDKNGATPCLAPSARDAPPLFGVFSMRGAMRPSKTNRIPLPSTWRSKTRAAVEAVRKRRRPRNLRSSGLFSGEA